MKNTREANGRKQNLRIKTEQNRRKSAGKERKFDQKKEKIHEIPKKKKINETILEATNTNRNKAEIRRFFLFVFLSIYLFIWFKF